MEIIKIFNFETIRNAAREPNFKKSNIILENFIKETLPKLNKKKMSLVKIGGGHELRFFNLWNSFIKGKLKTTDYEYMILIDSWRSMLLKMTISFKINKNFTKKQFLNDLKSSYLEINDKECLKTGSYISVFFDKNMSFNFEKFVTNNTKLPDGRTAYGGSFQLISKKVEFSDSIKEKIITFKTGNLIINDWFRTSNNEFTNAIKKDDVDFNINSPKGRVESISHYADLNFISVNVGNSCPSVFSLKNNIYIGEGPEMKKGTVYKGNVCTDLWNASVIEEEHFIDLLVKNGMSKSKANQELKKIKKVWTCISIKVKPGKYKLSFCGSYQDFNKKYRKKHKNHNLGKYTPYFTLEKM